MKVQNTDSTIESHGEIETKRFGISDGIQTLLRKNLYSTPQQTCIQEVICNARDANRENHRPTVPIKISGLTLKNPNLVVRDSGVGISPKRLEYFCTYGASTKTKSDTQTGGWGLGCKSPFAIADSFLLDTVYADSEDPSVKWHCTYNLFIDGQGFSSATPLIKEITDPTASTYTEISIPFESENFYDAFNDVTRAVEYWGHKAVRTSVPPDITDLYGGYHEISTPDLGEPVGSKAYYTHTSELKLIIDGILYDSLKTKFVNSLPKSKGFTLFFNTGEVEISPNRETINESEKTHSAILSALDEVWDRVAAEWTEFENSRIQGLNPLESWGEVKAFLENKPHFYNVFYKNSDAKKVDVSDKFPDRAYSVTEFCKGGEDGEIDKDVLSSPTLEYLFNFQKRGGVIVFQDTKSARAPLVRGALENGDVILISQKSQYSGFSQHYENLKRLTKEERELFFTERAQESLKCITKFFSEEPWSYLKPFQLLSSFPSIIIRTPRKKADKPENSATRWYNNKGQTIPISKKGVRVYIVARGSKFFDSKDKDASKEVKSSSYPYAWQVHCSKVKKLPENWISLSDYLEKHNKNRLVKRDRITPEQALINEPSGVFLKHLHDKGFILPPCELATLSGKVNTDYCIASNSVDASADTIDKALHKRYPLIPFGDYVRHLRSNYLRHLYQYIKAVSTPSPKKYIP